MPEKWKRWNVAPDIDSPCADISFSYNGPNALAVTMHFSRIIDRPNRDLVLWFKDAIALRWWTEASVLSEYHELLPKCSTERWRSWSFPLIKVQNSSWLRQHAARDPVQSQGREHFLLVSMNDVCELLAVSVIATWVNADSGA